MELRCDVILYSKIG